MSGWALFWYIVLIAALVSYFGLAFVITIGGYFDLKKMFRRLNEAHASEGPCEQGSGVTLPETDDRGAP